MWQRDTHVGPYDDFFVVSQEECEEQIRFVEKLVKDIKKFMVTQWNS